MMMMVDTNQDDGDDDSDRTETYTPPLDITNDLNISSEKENHYKDSSVNKQQSIIVLGDSSDPITNTEPIDSGPPGNSLFSFSIQLNYLSFSSNR